MKAVFPSDFGLTEKLIEEIDSFNEKQEKKSEILAIIISIFAFLLLAYFIVKASSLLGGIMLMVGLCPFEFMIGYSFFLLIQKIIFKKHIFSKNLNKYREELSKYKAWLLRTKLEFWYSLSGFAFEEEVTKLLCKNGFSAVKTRGSGDGGIDINIRDASNNSHIIVQCKAYKKKLSPHAVRDLYGTLISSGANSAILINLSGFSTETKKFAEGKNITLWDVSNIIALSESLN